MSVVTPPTPSGPALPSRLHGALGSTVFVLFGRDVDSVVSELRARPGWSPSIEEVLAALLEDEDVVTVQRLGALICLATAVV